MPSPSLLHGLIRHVMGLFWRSAQVLQSLRAMGVVFAVWLALAGVLLAKDLYDSTVRDTERNLLSLTTLLARQADESLQAIELVQAAVADDFSVARSETEQDFARRASSVAVHDLLVARIAALPQICEIVLLDSHGRPLASSHAWPMTNTDPSPSPLFEALVASPDERSVMITPAEGKGLAVSIAHRITGTDGRLLGFSLGHVDLQYFETLYTQVSPDAADVISIVHRDGTMLARHPNPPGSIGRMVPQLTKVRTTVAGDREASLGRIVSPIDGQDRFIATRSLLHYPMIVGASRTAEAVLAGWRKQAIALGTATTMLVAGVIVLISVAARRIRDQQRLSRSEAARIAAEERAWGERRLRDEYARFGTALDSMHHGLALFDAKGKLAVLSARFAEIYAVPDDLRRPGVPFDRMLDHLRTAMGANEATCFATALREAVDALTPKTLACALADGRIIGISVAPVAGGGFVFTCEDETERRRAEATIAHMAHHDALTGLPNRLLLGEATRGLLASPQRHGGAMLLLDLDGFKQVNDVHGHPLGDALLRLVAERLRGLVEAGDLLARLGGDEFAMVRHAVAATGEASGSQPRDAILLAQRIVEALKAPFVVGEESLRIGTSIGIALADAADCTPELLLRNADIALYQAKAAGRGTWRLYDAPADAMAPDRSAPDGPIERSSQRRAA